ncbi:hypothetical protein [Aliiroseovarius marinus]
MTNPIAMTLAILILSLIGYDYFVQDGINLLFLAKKLMELTEYLAFWR